MEIKNGFSDYAAAHPEQTAESKHISHALRIAGIDTMEELRKRFRLGSEELLKIRGISAKRLERIKDILRFYEAMAPPRMEETEKFAQGAPCVSSGTADHEPLSSRNMKEVRFYEETN